MKKNVSNDPNVFAGCRVGTIKAALLRRLETAGYFSVETSPTREFYAWNLAPIQTIKECREHVEEVERAAAKYRRTPPISLKRAITEGYQVIAISVIDIANGKTVKGSALIRERQGLQREFLVPIKSPLARLVFGKPRATTPCDYLRF